MLPRRTLTFGTAAVVLAVLLAVLAVQRGLAVASPLAQATQTELATEAVTGTATEEATEAVTGTATDEATDQATEAATGTATVAATSAGTNTPGVTATPTTTRAAPTPIGTQPPLPSDLPARTITVTGLGEASAPADEAFVQVGVQTDADTASEALDQNNQQMEALLEALTDAGVLPADITTQYVTLYPRYEEGTGGGNGIAGYTAINSVEARVRDLNSLGDLLDAAVAAGGNTIGGIRFSVSDTEELSTAARADAIDDARTKAQQLAALANGRLGPVLSISERQSGGPIAETGDLGGTVVVPGSQRLQVNLEVTWLLQ